MDWKKIIIIALDTVIGVYLVLVMMSFIKPDEAEDICTDIHINISKESEEGFLSEKDVRKILGQAKLSLLSQPMKLINTRLIEETLEKSIFVEKAECYKSQDGHLCINVAQRTPVLHVMAESGDRYYLDIHGEVIPDNSTAIDLIVATGLISRKYAKRVLTPLANQLLSDRFWQSQIEQVYVRFDGSVELVPRVGSHIVYLGQPVDIVRKLDRLRKFYLYGLSKAGWNKYSLINIEFDNQIICKKRPRRNANE
jgi:cell division protein FtsQ